MTFLECLDCHALAYDGEPPRHYDGCEGAEERGNIRRHGPDRCPACHAILDVDALDRADPVPPPRAPLAQGNEAAIQRAVLVRYGALPGLRLWRNSVGIARDATTGAHIRFGLARGSSDLIGIAAPHGRFLAPEIKGPRGVVTAEQAAWLAMVRAHGGVSGVVRSLPDMAALVEEARRP